MMKYLKWVWILKMEREHNFIIKYGYQHFSNPIYIFVLSFWLTIIIIGKYAFICTKSELCDFYEQVLHRNS